MRYFVILLILCFTSISFTIPGEYKQDINNAVQFLKKEQNTIDRIASSYDCPQSEVLSIVFPEIIRYSRYKNFFETKVLEQLYVLKGKGWADFSIGVFQMKPSFVEDLEYHVQHIPDLKTHFQDVIDYKEIDEERIRFERIERLKSFEWQLKYAFCYYYIINKCYGAYQFSDDEARLRFFSTAYNFGFTKPFDEIEAWTDEKAFPYGKKFKAEQFAFCELSIVFYKHHFAEYESTP